MNPQDHGSYALLIAKLRPLAAFLTTLDLSSYDIKNHDTYEYMHYVLPSGGLLAFKALKELRVQYACLLDPVDPTWSHITAPTTDTLPASLERLFVCYPKI